jgi:hypothetical protein
LDAITGATGMTKGNSYLIDLTAQLHHQTDKAILVSGDGERDNAVWLPLSQVEWVWADEKHGVIEVTLSEWLAIDKGMI